MSAKVAPDENVDSTARDARFEGTAIVGFKSSEELIEVTPRGTHANRCDVPEHAPIKQLKDKKASGVFGFSDAEAIKEKVRSNKVRAKSYNVHDCYFESGIFQKVAKDPRFENLTLGIIVVNALWISIDTDLNKSDTMFDNNSHAVFITADVLFFGYFSLELFIRFMAFRRKRDGFRDAWFVFDTTLVTLYAFDPFTLGIMAVVQGGSGLDLPTAVLRLFRLARLSRLVRMLRSLPELMIMIKGMVSAAASVSYTLGLLLMFTYVFSIAIRNLLTAEDDEVFAYGTEDGVAFDLSSVPETMHSLIVFGTFLDALADFIIPLKEQNTPVWLLTWIYILLAACTVMNMLIGVLCEVISAVAVEEKESMIVDKVHEKFDGIVKQLDKDGDGGLSWEEFQKILDFPEALAALESVNVCPESMVDMAEDFFFEDGEPVEVSFDEFMEMVLDLRGGQQATVKDIMGLGKRFNSKIVKTNSQVLSLEERLKSIDDKLEKLM